MLVKSFPLLTFLRFLCRIKGYMRKSCGGSVPRRLAAALLPLLLLQAGCRPAPPDTEQPPDSSIPAEELRGVWVSYLDLAPLLADADPATAARALDGVMDTVRDRGLNTVFFHVRSHSDALYPSAVYPAAEVAAPLLAAGFDPLGYAVEAAHQRGLTLHAWINPYRIGEAPPTGDAPTHFQKGDTWYYAPSDPAARRLVLDGVREILDTYAVDGIHFDDYFYPAGMAPEGETFESVPVGGDITAWRQTQVDALISAVYGLSHSRGRPFGVSPMAAIERNRTEAYADVTRWMAQPGYIDYILPQLYTGFEHQTQPFTHLLDRWIALPRRDGVRLYGGLALYKAGLADDPYAGTGRGEWAEQDDIIARQVTALQERTDGFALFRYAQLTDPAAQNEMENLRVLLTAD